MAELSRKRKETGLLKEREYFAYGSNMNLDQMAYRCPAATVVGNVRLEGYRLAFRGKTSGNGVATILPEEGSHVDGVLWKITEACERSLDRYEGYPYFYDKQEITVTGRDGKEYQSLVYVMNAPHKECPAVPSRFYLEGILEGCSQNGLEIRPVKEAELRTAEEVTKIENPKMPRNRTGKVR